MKTCPCNIQIIFSAVKNDNFVGTFLHVVNSFAQKYNRL